jgi:3',5'-nucleoside bisphosphate phosphatase
VIDLHLHTDASADGQHSPAELFAMAAGLGLTWLAFADHNTMAALPDGLALSQKTGIGFIAAVELNTQLDGRELHLLGYGMRPELAEAKEWFQEITELFHGQAARRVERFVHLGLRLTLAEVLDQSGGRLPTGSSFFNAMVKHEENCGHELIAPYLALPPGENAYIRFYFEVMAAGGPADVEAASLPTREAIRRLRGIGAAPVVAHPGDMPVAAVEQMVDAGLVGIEAICSYHDRIRREAWVRTADRLGLLHTAGSDFHGAKTKPAVSMGGQPGAGPEIVARLQAAIAALR